MFIPVISIPQAVLYTVTSPVYNESASLTVAGIGFHPSAVITLGDSYQPDVTFVSQTQLTLDYVADSLPPGTYDVSYLDSNGQISTIADGFTVAPVSIGSITSPVSNGMGEQILTMDGQGFRPSAVVHLGTYVPVVVYVSSMQLTVFYVDGSLAAGTYDVTYTDDNQSTESVLGGGLVVT